MSFKKEEIIKNNKNNIIIDKIRKTNDYIKGLSKHDNSQLTEIYEEEKTKNKLSPIVEPEVGRFISLYTRSINAKKVLELGTGPGYSTIWLGEALKYTKGELISIEIDKDKYLKAKNNIKAAALDSIIELKLQDALCYIDSIIYSELTNSIKAFDLIFIDLEKTLYPELIDKCIKITSSKGTIIADDTLFKPKGLRKKISEPIDEYNRLVFSDERLYSTILPIGDGLTMSLKV